MSRRAAIPCMVLLCGCAARAQSPAHTADPAPRPTPAAPAASPPPTAPAEVEDDSRYQRCLLGSSGYGGPSCAILHEEWVVLVDRGLYRPCWVLNGERRGCLHRAYSGRAVVYEQGAYRECDIVFGLIQRCGAPHTGLAVVYAPDAPEPWRRRSPTPYARIGAPIVAGDVDSRAVRRRLRRRRSAVVHCYERALLSDATLRGQVDAMFVIEPSGSVEHTEASGVSPEVASCVADVLAELELAEPANEATMVWVSIDFGIGY